MQSLPQWLKTRKRLLEQIKSQVSLRLGPETAELRDYAESFRKEFKGHWKPSSVTELRESILKNRLVFGADFHAFAQAQRTHIRILRNLPSQIPVILALECFQAKHQKWIDQYMAGEIAETEFLEAVEWKKKWGFPWEHYRPLLNLARRQRHRVCGINKYYRQRTVTTLTSRDEFSARKILELRQAYPGSLVYVIYGDLHLGCNNLPKKLASIAKTRKLSIPLTFIYQNSEQLYFRLAKQSKETDVEILKSGRDKFCVLGSPPWVKWQSYLMYLEHTYDQDLEEEDAEDSLDFTDHVHGLIQLIVSDLSLHVSTNELAVYSPKENFWELLQKSLSVEDLRLAEYMISNDRSFFLPEAGFLYLSRYSLNHSASLAGEYIHAKLSARQRVLWDLPTDFERLIWMEGVSFFFSKWINHKRKAESLRDLKAHLAVTNPKDRGREALLLALDQRMIEIVKIHGQKTRPRKFKPKRKESYIEAARLLGSMLGEKLYMAFTHQEISEKTLKSYFSKNLFAPDFDRFYERIIKKMESQNSMPEIL